jgi:hypothetical protein
VTMSHFRLCYRDPGQRFNVVIMEAPSMQPQQAGPERRQWPS